MLSALSDEVIFHTHVQAITLKFDSYFIFLLEEEMYRRNLRFKDYGISKQIIEPSRRNDLLRNWMYIPYI